MNNSPGPLRNGNPRGNPNLAPRCGAACRGRMGLPCRSPAMANGRCRMHGGCSTGPISAEGLARIRAANTRHGHYAKQPDDPFLEHVRRLQHRINVTLRLCRLGLPWQAIVVRLRDIRTTEPSPEAMAYLSGMARDLMTQWEEARRTADTEAGTAPEPVDENPAGMTPCTVTRPTPGAPATGGPALTGQSFVPRMTPCTVTRAMPEAQGAIEPRMPNTSPRPAVRPTAHPDEPPATARQG